MLSSRPSRTLAPHTISEFLLSSWAPKHSAFTTSRMSVQRLLGAPKPVLAGTLGCSLPPNALHGSMHQHWQCDRTAAVRNS